MRIQIFSCLIFTFILTSCHREVLRTNSPNDFDKGKEFVKEFYSSLQDRDSSKIWTLIDTLSIKPESMLSKLNKMDSMMGKLINYEWTENISSVVKESEGKITGEINVECMAVYEKVKAHESLYLKYVDNKLMLAGYNTKFDL